MSEQVKLYDEKHFCHTRYDGYLEIGATTVNADNYSKPVKREGKAPCVLLAYCYNWSNREEAETSLNLLGYEQKNEVVWEKK